ncbi:phosphohistidine phosphatase SixA [Stutzerimonas kirkiae]|uniref:Phosphohistidine phosphatase SixA n=1 Tax=Stutzerimonas kirkiae TaxID=2211392 RepID=A0A4Q9QZF1_9GAMM|nr:phosphohistidine phosphatase SixA [Stutzerimonas kirkiae]TBU91309.1 phosphohistidine phosphatase SixA [Stutzerimonas kirkiae]TBV00421.1 phosphohistidine phosphatase SixA [Stutzerimonas kirkiae]TBV11787.1 phosphohistidine phosphatase SixA [Stutzerimonas kirkiae]TBV15286.1 phosphohistidine phosphatase SixA [Stutzerimonas kirkiae]
MKLWLLRHGEAERRTLHDPDRHLTDEGRLEVAHNARRLQGEPLQVMLVSPYRRAQQTADVVRQALGYEGAYETHDWLIPDAEPEEAMRQLDRRSETHILLVTHQPFVGALAGWLVNGHRGDPLSMSTGSLVGLEGEAVAAGLMNLVGKSR